MNPDRHPMLSLRPAHRRLLARRLLTDGAPAAAAGWRGWLGLRPEPVTGDVLLLAAGLLLSARPGLSTHLVVQVVGRGRDPRTVREALDWLLSAGYLRATAGAPGALHATEAAEQLLQALAIPARARRHHEDLSIPSHLGSMLAPPASQPWRSPPASPPPSSPAGMSSGRPSGPGARRLGLTGQRAVPVAVGLGLAVAAWWLAPLAVPPAAPRAWSFAIEALPASRGTMLQLDRRGMMLSTFAGDLFESLPDRLDFKQPVHFNGFDMAADCGLVSPHITTAALSPDGRFLYAESARTSSPERCLVDLETRTIAHDLPTRVAAFRSPHLVGWLSDTEIALSDRALPEAGPWQVVDVTSWRARALPPPTAPLALRIGAADGPVMRADLTPDGVGWRLSSAWWAEGQGFDPGPTIGLSGEVPAPEARPRQGALSPDRRQVLIAWSGASSAAMLTVTTLSTGETVRVPLSRPPVLTTPLFWSPDHRSGRYRCWVTLDTPDGPQPCSFELTRPEGLRQTASERSARP